MHTWGEACERAEFVAHAYVLMGNHYHFLLETPKPSLVSGMAWFQATYTVRFNTRHRLSGHLFQGRYKSVIIDGSVGASFRRIGALSEWLPEERKPGSLLDIARTEGEESALKLLQKGLKIVGLTLEGVRGMKSPDSRKDVLTWLLKRRTPMRNTWISERLQIGHSSRVCMLVRIVQSDAEGSRAELKAAINSAFDD